MGYSLWGCKESDTTEPLTHTAANGIISFFLWLSSIPLCVCVLFIYIHTSSFSHSSVDELLGCLERTFFTFAQAIYLTHICLIVFLDRVKKKKKTPQPYEVGSNHTKHYVLIVKMWFWGSSLLVQWLRLHAPHAGGLGLIPDQGARSHMPQLRAHKLQWRTWVLQPRTGTAEKRERMWSWGWTP